MKRAAPMLVASVTALATMVPARGEAQPLFARPEVVGDAIPAPLTAGEGNAARGRAIVASRQAGLCLLCHSGPIPEERLQGNLAPPLNGAGARWSVAQLRLRIVDASRLNPRTIMPSYYRIDDLDRVAPAFRGKPILTSQQIEDVVAYLATLKE